MKKFYALFFVLSIFAVNQNIFAAECPTPGESQRVSTDELHEFIHHVQEHNDALNGNAIIEQCFMANIDYWYVDQLRTIKNGFRATPFDHENDRSTSINRILWEFFDLKKRYLFTDEAIRLAHLFVSPLVANEVIEVFVMENKIDLTREQVTKLVENLHADHHDDRSQFYGKYQTAERIWLDWGTRETVL